MQNSLSNPLSSERSKRRTRHCRFPTINSVGKRQCRVLADCSGAAGIDIIGQKKGALLCPFED